MLTIGLVTFHSPIGPLATTLESLRHAIRFAIDRGQIDRARLFLIDNSVNPDYQRQLAELLGKHWDSTLGDYELVPTERNLGYGGSAPNLSDYIVFGPFMWQRLVTMTELYATPAPVAQWRERMLDLYGGYAREAKSAEAA